MSDTPPTPARTRTPPVTESATARLTRLLALVPWLLAHQGVPLTEAATEFGVSEAQLVADLELLFVCGTPGGLPGDLIEAEWEDGKVYLGNADTIARPLRLTLDEAVPLLVGLRALTSNPQITERDAALRALRKLEDATGSLGAMASSITVQLADPADERSAQVLAAARDALARHRRVRLTYWVPSRDEVSEREVDPMRLVAVGTHWYLEGWCHRAEDVRLFRVDRIEDLRILDVDGTAPPQAEPRELAGQVFHPSESDLEVVLRLRPSSAWVAEYYPVESVEPMDREDPSSGLRVTLRAGDTAWVVRLALRSGGEVVIESPTALADEVRQAARAALSAYPDGSA